MKIKLVNARLAYPHLFEPHAMNPGDKPAFSAAFLLPPDHPQLSEVNDIIEQVAKGKWGDKADVVLKAIRAADRTCLHDGNIKADLPGYAGNLFINARSYDRPNVFDRDRTRLEKVDGLPYAGCYVHAILDIYAQDHKSYGKRINASLSGVMFYKDGEAFAGGDRVKAEDFGDLEFDESDVTDLV